MEIIALDGIGEITTESNLAVIITSAIELRDHDIVVVTSKVVSKAEGRIVACGRTDFTTREQLIRRESRRILRQRESLFITETHHGFICANAGIDWSNIAPGQAVLLPKEPDKSAHDIRNAIRGINGCDIAVIISDSFGRTWRNGTVDVAIGCAGLSPIDDYRGNIDSYGNELIATQICTADEIASAASLVMRKTAQTPIAIIRGLDDIFGSGSIRKDVVRSPQNDLFR